MVKKNSKSIRKHSTRKSEFIIPLVIFTAALAVRLIYLFQSRTIDPQFYYPVIDALFHHQWARQIADGDFSGIGAFFRAPLYPYFLAIIYKIFGVNIFAAKIIQAIIGAFCACFTFLLTKNVFGKTAGIIAGTMMVLFAPAVFYEGELLLDPLSMFLVLSAVMVTLRAFSKAKILIWPVAGLLWGLSAVCRPTTLVMLFVVVVIILTKTSTVSKIRRRNIGLLLLGTAIIILPVTIRNYIAGDEFILIASQGGVNFYIGNNSYADGTTASIPELPTWDYRDAVAIAENDVGRRLGPSEISLYYFKKGLQFWRDKPLNGIALYLKKFIYFWTADEIPNNRSFYFVKEFPTILKYLPVTFTIIGPLSLLGLCLIFLKRDWRRPEVYFLAGIIVVHLVTHLFFFINGRFRLPVIPLLAGFSGASIMAVLRMYKEKLYRQIIGSSAILIVALLITIIDVRGQVNDEIAEGWNSVGMTYLDKGDLSNAEKAFFNARSRDPRMFMVNLNLASVAFYGGDINVAENYLLAELNNNPQEIRALNNLSMIYRMQGKAGEARRFAERAVEFHPAHREPYINLCLALELLGMADSARKVVDSALNKYSYFHQLRLYSGELYLNEGDTALAVADFQNLLNTKDDISIKYADVEASRAADKTSGVTLEQLRNEATRRLSELGVRK